MLVLILIVQQPSSYRADNLELGRSLALSKSGFRDVSEPLLALGWVVRQSASIEQCVEWQGSDAGPRIYDGLRARSTRCEWCDLERRYRSHFSLWERCRRNLKWPRFVRRLKLRKLRCIRRSLRRLHLLSVR